MTGNLAKYFTTTVGLICTRLADDVNIMAAEWTYLVAKEPPHVAVVLSEKTLTGEVAPSAGEFCVTLCSARQAALADFVGSVSGREIDKTATELLSLRPSGVVSTPWAAGGLIALECRVQRVVPLPGYQMLIGEVLAAHADDTRIDQPLVKHQAMHALGGPLLDRTAVAAAELRGTGEPELRVAASGPLAAPGAPWRVTLVSDEEGPVPLGEARPNQAGDLLASFRLPEAARHWDLSRSRVCVEREGLDPGQARISSRGHARSVPGPGREAAADAGLSPGRQTRSPDVREEV